jgi:hypothetical protein
MPAGSSSGQPADKATVAAVTKAYAVFFSPKSSLAASLQALQHGPVFRTAVVAQSNSSQAQHAGARVTKVVLLSPQVAAVTFDVLVSGAVLLPNRPGNAVRENGRWKVAAKTFCDLLALTNQAPQPCKDPNITRLPG